MVGSNNLRVGYLVHVSLYVDKQLDATSVSTVIVQKMIRKLLFMCLCKHRSSMNVADGV